MDGGTLAGARPMVLRGQGHTNHARRGTRDHARTAQTRERGENRCENAAQQRGFYGAQTGTAVPVPRVTHHPFGRLSRRELAAHA